jgi:DNA-binding NtrC family response regulator
MVAYKRILVVDDDPAVLFVFNETLQALDRTNEIVTAQNGLEALSELGKKPFDLVITDLNMPDMDGVQLTEAIRALHSEMPVIWVTGLTPYNFASDAERLGVICCRDKPLEIWQILQLARDAFSDDEEPT